MYSARVIILEDDFYARDALAQRMNRDDTIQVVGEAQRPEQVFSLLGENNVYPDLLLVDLDFPSQPSQVFVVLKTVRNQYSRLRILCLTLSPAPDILQRVLKVGVDGLLQKNECADGIGLSINQCLKGRFVTTPSVAQLIATHSIERSCYVVPEIELPREMTSHLRQVAYLRYVRGLTTNQIAEDLFLSPYTVRSYLKHIKAILNITGRRNLLTRGFMTITRLLWRND